MNNKKQRSLKTLAIGILLLSILCFSMLYILYEPFTIWFNLSIWSLATKGLGLGGVNNGDNDNNNDTDGDNGNNNTQTQYYINLSVNPDKSKREDVQTIGFSITTNLPASAVYTMQYRYKGTDTWKTRTNNSPENDFFAGYYEWRVTSGSTISNTVETQVDGISFWANGQFEITNLNVALGQQCYYEDGSTYKNWLVFYYYYNPVWKVWALIQVGRTDNMGKIFGQGVTVNAPMFAGLYPTKATINTIQAFADAPIPEHIAEFEDWIWQNGLEPCVPDPNMANGQVWYRESNPVNGNVS